MIRLRPILEGDAVIQGQTQAVSREKEGIRVTAEFYNQAKLETVTDVIAHNPFVNEWRVVCTVFELQVENKREGKITVDPSKCVILDGLGHQLNALTVGDFERWYPTTSTHSLTYSYVFNEYTPTVVYTPDYYRRKVVQEKLLKGGELYPGVKTTGLIAFEIINAEASQVTVIVPVVTEDGRRVEFTFPFAHEIHPVR